MSDAPVIQIDNKILEKWGTIADDLDDNVRALRVPFAVLLSEATDCAGFVERYWEPKLGDRGRQLRPGLRSVAGTGQFSADIAAETLELAQALQLAQAKYQLASERRGKSPVAHARFLLSELKKVLRWVFDDGKRDESDSQLAQLVKKHSRAQSHRHIAAALYDYAELAKQHRETIDGVGDFDVRLIEEAREAALALREFKSGSDEDAEAEKALELRNRIGLLLYQRMQRIRAAARFVFRQHRDIVREVTSDHARKQRADYRQAKAEEAARAQAELEAAREKEAAAQQVKAQASAVQAREKELAAEKGAAGTAQAPEQQAEQAGAAPGVIPSAVRAETPGGGALPGSSTTKGRSRALPRARTAKKKARRRR